MVERSEVLIVGAGIVGLATAHQILTARPGTSLLILEKEARPASHQTGHNSGVIHSGLYYSPGSHKAAMVASGRRELEAFCDDNGVRHETCGKVVVAIDESETPRLDALETRAAANGVAAERLGPAGLHEREPHVAGVGALLVPSAGIVDFGAVCDALVRSITERGARVVTGAAVRSIRETGAAVHVETDDVEAHGEILVNCAGLQSDRVAQLAGAYTGGVRIMPFRGEYFELVPERRFLCNDLVYPLPDPAFPFLGVHLTRMIDGSVHAGPNAVPALAREGYRWRDIDRRDLFEVLGARRTYRLARQYWRTGAAEINRSLRRAAFVRALQRLCPEITGADLERSPAGVRAQAIDADGRLLDDFAFAETPRTVHVVNAPSPAATASFAIGRTVAGKVLPRLATT